MLILNNNEIETLLTHQQLLEAVEAAIISYEKKTSDVPQRMHFDHGNDTLLCMPSLNEHSLGIKIVSVVPGNAAKKLPVTNGVFLLNDIETGLPLAFMNASILTALRTGAVGATGLKYITPENSDSIGLIGSGVQGMYQALFACCVRPIKIIYCLFRNEDSFKKLQHLIALNYPHVKVLPCANTDELLLKTNIIITATTSPTPVLTNQTARLKEKHFISVGSYKPSMQELPDEVYQFADELIIDSEFARHESGDSIRPIEKDFIKKENIFTVGKLITGERKVDVTGTTVYKTTGMALFDLFVAQYMFRIAKQKNIGTSIQL